MDAIHYLNLTNGIEALPDYPDAWYHEFLYSVVLPNLAEQEKVAA